VPLLIEFLLIEFLVGITRKIQLKEALFPDTLYTPNELQEWRIFFLTFKHSNSNSIKLSQSSEITLESLHRRKTTDFSERGLTLQGLKEYKFTCIYFQKKSKKSKKIVFRMY